MSIFSSEKIEKVKNRTTLHMSPAVFLRESLSELRLMFSGDWGCSGDLNLRASRACCKFP
jgi:hypothetical protein